MEQLTLQEVIDKLSAIDLYDQEGEPKQIGFDFGGMAPTTVDSWRGSYNMPALGFEVELQTTADVLLKELKDAVGRKVQGYKGGEYTLKADAYLQVDNYGRYTETGIYDITDHGWYIVINTTHFSY